MPAVMELADNRLAVLLVAVPELRILLVSRPELVEEELGVAVLETMAQQVQRATFMSFQRATADLAGFRFARPNSQSLQQQCFRIY